MGLPRPPAFLDPSLNEDAILENGVNYASGGGGILNETGSLFVTPLQLFPYITNSRSFLEFPVSWQLITAGAEVWLVQANRAVSGDTGSDQSQNWS